ncbi:hypothetical protein [Microcoleus sp.]|uniref:hypothetical protein n=1 Tax=Microcoleus sp. TaxID=44472 RepID=UPI003525FB2F
MSIQFVQSLKGRIESEIEILERNIKGQKSVNFLIKTRCSINSLKSIAARLVRIKALLEIQDYNLVFIGKIGVGKTTAICHLFNLFHAEEKPVGKTGKTVNKISELLSTGAGRTTICEVVIQPFMSKRSFLEIEPHSDDEVKELIRQFCIYFWNKEHDQNPEVNKLPSAELLKAIRNIVDLPDRQIEGKRVDKARELAQSSKSLDGFLKSVLERANLSRRNQTRLESLHNFESVEDEKKWLRNNFSNLNLGKMDKFSLPKKIYVGVSNKLIEFNKYPRFISIIDTRGMDDDARDRKDLSDYIRNQDNSICLFAEQFLAAPSNVSELLKRYLTRESRDIDKKVALLVLPRKGEPEDVGNLDGKVENRDEGIDVRKNQIDDAFARENVNFLSENIFFYDALQFYDEEHILKPQYEKDDVLNARIKLLGAINDLISRRERALLQEVKDYEGIFQDIKSGGGLSPQEEKLINDLKKTIESHEKKKFLSDFENRYKNHLKSYNAMVFRAINNRFGTYDLRDIDIYFDGSTVAEALLRDRFRESKAEIIGAVELVEKYASEQSGLKPVMKILSKQIDEYFEKFIIEIGQEICCCIKDSLAPQTDSNEFWDYAQNRWGQGHGYRDDVLDQYGSQINSLDDWLVERVQEVWKQNFMDRILEFFCES